MRTCCVGVCAVGVGVDLLMVVIGGGPLGVVGGAAGFISAMIPAVAAAVSMSSCLCCCGVPTTMAWPLLTVTKDIA